MRREIIEKRLISYAHWYAASQGYQIGDGAEHDIEYMAEQAIVKMFGEKIPTRFQSRHLAMLIQAEASFAMLIATMIQGSKEISGYSKKNPDRIGEETMGWARSRICPLFPIC